MGYMMDHGVYDGPWGIPGSGMKSRVGLGMGIPTFGYGQIPRGIAHKILGVLKITRFSCSPMISTIIRIVFT
jgi:hypothetical protein